MTYFTEDTKFKELRSLFEGMENQEVFHRFAPEGKQSFLAKWGSSEQSDYQHLGKLDSWSFNPQDNVLRFTTRTDPLVSEDLFNRIATPAEADMHDILLDSDYADFEDLFIDSVVANYLKKNGYAGVIFTLAKNPGKKNAMDIREYGPNIDKVYNGFMKMDKGFLSSLQ